MFPHALKRPIGPTESLFSKRLQSIGCFSPRDCVFFISDLLAKSSDLQRQILIFRQRIRREAPSLFQEVPAPGATCAGNDSYAIQTGERSAVHVLRRDVLKCLPSRNYVESIAYLCIARHGAYLRVVETMR